MSVSGQPIDSNASNAYIAVMATLTIRNLDEGVKRELRKRAAEHGVSMEEEVRRVLGAATARATRGRSIAGDLRKLASKPAKPFDQKTISDELWDDSLG